MYLWEVKFGHKQTFFAEEVSLNWWKCTFLRKDLLLSGNHTKIKDFVWLFLLQMFFLCMIFLKNWNRQIFKNIFIKKIIWMNIWIHLCGRSAKRIGRTSIRIYLNICHTLFCLQQTILPLEVEAFLVFAHKSAQAWGSFKGPIAGATSLSPSV